MRRQKEGGWLIGTLNRLLGLEDLSWRRVLLVSEELLVEHILILIWGEILPDRIQILVWREILVKVFDDMNLWFHCFLLHPLNRESFKTLQVSD